MQQPPLGFPDRNIPLENLPVPAMWSIVAHTEAYDWPFLRLVNTFTSVRTPLFCSSLEARRECNHQGLQISREWREAVDLQITKMRPTRLDAGLAARFPRIEFLCLSNLDHPPQDATVFCEVVSALPLLKGLAISFPIEFQDTEVHQSAKVSLYRTYANR